MRRKLSAACAAMFIAGFLVPAGTTLTSSADQRCTPIAHVLDANTIPGNANQDPDPSNPDETYHDKAGLNCIPTYELDFTGALDGTLPSSVYTSGRCDPESAYDQVAAAIQADPDFYAACRRLKFTMGPIIARPGMNDSLINVTTFEHPMYDGYTLRWKPGLQSADGSVPPVETLHLHHGTWLGGVNGPSSVVGPFFATGEEQTILQFPKGYGWTMQGMSAWEMLYMIHNALPTTQAVYITYDIDYIAKTAGDNLTWKDALGHTQTGIRDVKSIWMDAGAGGSQLTWDGSAASTNVYSPFNPLFNAQRGLGHVDDGAFHGLTGPSDPTNPLTTVSISQNAGTGKLVCTFPRENCAHFDSSQHAGAQATLQQGKETQSIIGHATDPAFADCPELGYISPGHPKQCAVLVNMGGHLHPGGLRDEVAVKRGNKLVPILISDAVYWGGGALSNPPVADYSNPELAGAPPKSWDLSMTGQLGGSAGTGRAKDAWKILVQPGDKLILNGVYDTAVGSAYDQMSIVMSWTHPGYEPDAIDPFDPNTIVDAGWEEGPNLTARPSGLPDAIDVGCTPGTVPAGEPNAGKTVLCLRGNVTHGSMPSRQNHADCAMASSCVSLTSLRVPLASTTITMQGFNYGQVDQNIAQVAGVPQVAVNTKLTFYNPDTSGMVWHTITACPEPCTGPTSANYPYPAAEGTPVDFDSTILCVGLGCSTAGTYSWEFTPTQTGMYTFFCRIHPFMRGAFEVT
ncbi:MAG: hypothetical protein LC750_09365 [Actinobacteria bacterium]|nr:hypothetical protein [Actinomycetota bacterium]